MTTLGEIMRNRPHRVPEYDSSARAMLRRMLGGPTNAACRDNEWEHAWCLAAVAVVLMLPGDSLRLPLYSTFDRMGLGEIMWAVIFGAVGVMRLTALKINGHRPQTPLFRMLGAFIGCLLWGNLFIQVVAASLALGQPFPLGLGLLFVMTISEARSFARARYDVRYFR